MMENPIYPDIRRAPPRFTWSRKHWDVDVGATMMNTENHTQFYENAVLAQARDYNQTIYGQSSHKDIVNANFRPPLIDQYEDLQPLTRIPVTTRSIHARINPQTVHDGYAAKNERKNDVEAHLTDLVSTGRIRPTFYCPMDAPQDNSVLPDLEMVLPSVSAHAGFKMPYTMDGEKRHINLEYQKLHPSGHSGFKTAYVIDGENNLQNVQLADNRPSVSADAGKNINYRTDIETPVIELFSNRPDISANAGFNTNYTADIETPVHELINNRPSVSATAGTNTIMQSTMTSQVSGNDIILETKIDPVLYTGNPEMQYKSRMDADTPIEDYIRLNKPNITYSIQPEVSYREQNGEYRPHFQQKLQPVKGSDRLTNASAIPKKNIEIPNIRMKSRIELAGIPKSKKYTLG